MRIHTETVLRMTDDPYKYIRISDEFYEYEGPLELADRAAQNQAGSAVQGANTTAGNYGQAANAASNTLLPALTNDINNPNGFTPTQQNQMLAASEQSAGGAGGAVGGEAALQAARTRNTGSNAGILDQAARRTAQNLSGNTLNIATKNAELGQQKRSQALGSLEGMYGTDVGAQLKAMGLVPEDINSEVSAGNSGWLQQGEGLMNTLSNGAMTGAKIAAM